MTPAQVAHIMPPLPKPLTLSRGDEDGAIQLGYTAEQMQAYARAAVEAALRDAPQQAEPFAWIDEHRLVGDALIWNELYCKANGITIPDLHSLWLGKAENVPPSWRAVYLATTPKAAQPQHADGYAFDWLAKAAAKVADNLREDGDKESHDIIMSLIRAHEMVAPSAPTAVEPDEWATCEWTLEDDDNGTWQSSCGELWQFIEGGPKENRVSFCHNCGKPAIVRASKGTP